MEDVSELTVEEMKDQVRWMRTFAKIEEIIALLFLAVACVGISASMLMVVLGSVGFAGMLSLAVMVNLDADYTEKEIRIREVSRS